MYLRSVESPTKAIKHNGKFNWLPKKILTRAQISLNGSRGGTKTERFTSQLNLFVFLSSPRAESARAVTGRRCPHSGRGEDFLSCQPDFFTETAVTPERKVAKWFPRWEINRHVEG